jgi:hypothetical protein
VTIHMRRLTEEEVRDFHVKPSPEVNLARVIATQAAPELHKGAALAVRITDKLDEKARKNMLQRVREHLAYRGLAPISLTWHCTPEGAWELWLKRRGAPITFETAGSAEDRDAQASGR